MVTSNKKQTKGSYLFLEYSTIMNKEILEKKEKGFRPTIAKTLLLCGGNLRPWNPDLCPAIYAGKHQKQRGKIKSVQDKEIALLFRHHENALDEHCKSCTVKRCNRERREFIMNLFLTPPAKEQTYLYGSKE